MTDGLTRLRRRSKLTQTDIAKQLGVTQAAISKVESGRDETLTLAIISAYARTSRQRINLSFGQPMTHVEAVKEHALGLRHHLEALASLAHKDEVIAKDVEGFFREAAANIDQIIAHFRERLPKQRKVEVRMLTQVAPSTPQPAGPRSEVGLFASGLGSAVGDAAPGTLDSALDSVICTLNSVLDSALRTPYSTQHSTQHSALYPTLLLTQTPYPKSRGSRPWAAGRAAPSSPR